MRGANLRGELRISTHAPVKERLEVVHDVQCELLISTHAPVKERRGEALQTLVTERNFNSRSCEGATSWHGASCNGGAISTHAPVKERPGAGRVALNLDVISTHAPVKERPKPSVNTAQFTRFQLTLL